MRTGAGVAPTPRAENLHPLVQGALEKLRALLVPPTFVPARSTGVISLATTDYALVPLLPRLLQRLRLKRPICALRFGRSIRQALNWSFGTGRSTSHLPSHNSFRSAWHSRRLFREHYVGVVRPKHPLAKGVIDAERFVAFPHLLVSPDKGDFSGPTDEALAKVGLRRNIALVVPSFSVVAAILRYHRSGSRAAIQTAGPNPKKAAFLRTTGCGRGVLDLHAYWPGRLNDDAMHKWFRKLIFESLSAACPSSQTISDPDAGAVGTACD